VSRRERIATHLIVVVFGGTQFLEKSLQQKMLKQAINGSMMCGCYIDLQMQLNLANQTVLLFLYLGCHLTCEHFVFLLFLATKLNLASTGIDLQKTHSICGCTVTRVDIKKPIIVRELVVGSFCFCTPRKILEL
jgi:hypothetical protein